LTRNDLQLQINKDTDTAEYIAWSGTTGTTLNGVVTCTTATCIQGLHFAHAAGEQLTGERLVSNANAAIDWNCNDVATQNPLSSDINRDNLKITLSSFNDWESLVFDGGAVGKLGEQVDLPASTPVDEIDKQTDEGNPTPFAVSIGSPSDLDVVVGASRTVVFEIVNEGDETDTYDLSATSSLGWAHIGHLDSPLSLGSGARREISIVVTVPPGTPEGTKDELTLTAQSQGNPNLLDSATTATTAFAPSLEELIEVIGKLGLPKGITQSLIAKLKPSAKDPSAANRLRAFINEVKAQRGKAIPTEVADELIVAATALL